MATEGLYIQAKQHEEYFDPYYYAEYYRNFSDSPLSDMHWMTTSQHHHYFNIFKTGEIKGTMLLDIGTGPVVSTSIIPSFYFDHIYWSDYLASNREALQDWLDQKEGCIDWSKSFNYVRNILEKGNMQGSFSNKDLAETLQAKVKGVFYCDVLSEDILPPWKGDRFDCITSSLCLMAACPTMAAFNNSVKYITGLLKPNGHFINSLLLGSDRVVIKGKRLDDLVLTKNDVRCAYEAAGLRIERWLQEPSPDEQVALVTIHAHKGPN